MAKTIVPVITHTEIISRAIRSVKEEIADWRLKCEGLAPEHLEAMFNESTEGLRDKLEALKQMYRFETGTEYV